MNIYIYGSQKFVKEINRLLHKSNIRDNIEHIKSLDVLKNTIKDNFDEIFIIDNEKILYETFFEKLNPFKPKDAIEKKFLDKFGVGDVCFNSLDGFVKYILNRLENIQQDDKKENNIDLKDIQEESVLENNTDENIQDQCEEPREIKCIDDIYDNEMEEVINNLNIQEDKKD